MTLLLGGTVFLAYSVAQGIALVPGVVLAVVRGASPARLEDVVLNGFSLALATAVGCPVMLLLCGLLVAARRGPGLAEYLALRHAGWGRLAGWTLLTVLLALGLSQANEWSGREPPEFIVQTYATAGYLPLFWAAVGVCAPVAEEVLFRGFLFAGLAASRLGNAGAVVVTTVLFTLVHGGQYGWVDLMQLATVGLLFGLARARTGSVLVALAMHIALNLTSLTVYALGEGA
jgi:hypothetical protein